MTTAIASLSIGQAQQINAAIDHYNTLVHFVRRSLRLDLDYGKVQGCGDKPILFKPGAEKIATLFGLRESLERLEAIKDWTGKDFGEPFFSYEYKCTLRDRSGAVIAECIGSCNSWEEKYRYRTAQRTCPDCGAAAIKRSNYPDKQTGDKGWYCHSKSGGCNAKFDSTDKRITDQEQGKVLNERIFDQVNTIDKMAQKRTFVGAVILAANAANFFAVEHSEINTIDADWEPQEDIDTADSLARIPTGNDISAADPGEVNRDRIRYVIQQTGHTFAQVRQLAGTTADNLDEVGMQRLINQLLIDFGKTRHITPPIASALIQEIRAEQPHITDNNLFNRFSQRCSEALAEQVSVRPQPTTVGGVSID
ncbi:MAG: hypothetical protein AAFQ89_09435 [Cyanobacteria bacterium J06626_18]